MNKNLYIIVLLATYSILYAAEEIVSVHPHLNPFITKFSEEELNNIATRDHVLVRQGDEGPFDLVIDPGNKAQYINTDKNFVDAVRHEQEIRVLAKKEKKDNKWYRRLGRWTKRKITRKRIPVQQYPGIENPMFDDTKEQDSVEIPSDLTRAMVALLQSQSTNSSSSDTDSDKTVVGEDPDEAVVMRPASSRNPIEGKRRGTVDEVEYENVLTRKYSVEEDSSGYANVAPHGPGYECLDVKPKSEGEC